MFIDWTAFKVISILLISSYVAKMLGGQAKTPFFYFSKLADFDDTEKGRSRFALLPNYLIYAALLSFVIAFLDPHLMIQSKAPSYPEGYKPPPPQEGIAIYLLLDRSGSMQAEVLARGAEGRTEMMPKIDILKQLALQFVNQRTSDLRGIVAFARVPQVLVPLTLDNQPLKEAIENLEVVKTPEEEGTALGYAIFKTAHLIAATRQFASEVPKQEKPPYDMKSAIMVIITDGFQDPSHLDRGNRLRMLELDEAADYAKSQGIRIYVVNVDPAFGTEEFAPHRRQMKSITEMTGGEFFLVQSGQNLQQVYDTIDKLEKGKVGSTATVKEQTSLQRISFYPFFIALGMLSFLGSLLLDTTFLRKVP